MSPAHELDDAVETALPDAMRLAVVVHDRDADGVREVLQPLATAGDWTGVMALCVALAALVPTDAPCDDLLGWTNVTELVPAGMKRCSTCRRIQPRDRFHRDASQKDGLKPRCKGCISRVRLERLTEEGAA